jgi:glycosyltransferase involved in cell wall biosynthesis
MPAVAEPRAAPGPPAGAAAPWTDLRVVLVHDWLTGMRGGEKVLDCLCRMFPSADLLTLVHVRGSVSAAIESRRIRPSLVQRLPRAAAAYRYYLPLFPSVIETFDLDDVDLVISTSHCAAKSVVPTGRAVHVCYCHSPMRYAWDQFDAYFGPARLGAAGSALARPVLGWLARWDRATANRVDAFAANSRFVAGRIGRYYNRQASVLYPPVDTQFFTPVSAPAQPYFLAVSALVPYKRLEIAIGAAQQLGVPLKIVGTGPDLARLQRIAGPTIAFLGALDPDALREAYRHARALVMPGEEDFGIAPVESMACGRPVIALGRGGALETVVPGVTGRLVAEPTVEAFADAMRAMLAEDLAPAPMVAHASRFSVAAFEDGVRRLLTQTLSAGAAC